MLCVNGYGACELSDNLDKALRDKVKDIVALGNEMNPVDIRVFEQVAILALVNEFAEKRLIKGMEIRLAEPRELDLRQKTLDGKVVGHYDV